MDDGATSASSIGMNVRELRKWRKMSLEGLAGLAGLSKGYLSKIENGHSAVNKRDTLIKIARALRVSVADLVGTAYLTERPDHDAHGAIPDIRVALLSATLDEAAQLPSRPIDQLTEQTRQVAEWRQLCRDADVGRALPPLLLDLHATAAGGGDDRLEALRNLVQASHSTTLFLKNFGAVDLAWVAADRGHQAAIALDDPVYVAASEFARAQALIGLGAYERADALAKPPPSFSRCQTPALRSRSTARRYSPPRSAQDSSATTQ